MPRSSRKLLLSAAASSAAALFSSSMASAQVLQPPSSGDRVLGLDVSAHQGNWSQTLWNNIHNVEDRDFAFIRSSRGGTTGEDHRQGGYPSGDNTFYSQSERYDDPYYVQNINRATTAAHGRPTTVPAIASARPRPTMSASVRSREAPSARRMPMSCVRAAIV